MSEPRAIVVKAVLCDMDGTLVNSNAVVEQLWAEFAAKFDLNVDEILATSHGRLTIETVRDFAPEGTDINAVTNDIESQELVRTEGVVEIPGAGVLMSTLVGNAPTALVTSAPRKLAEVRMEVSNVPLPSVAICAQDVDKGKPNPEGYLKAAAELGVDPTDSVVLEDAGAGVEAGLAAGCQVIIVGGLESHVAEGLLRVPDLTAINCEVVVDENNESAIKLTIN